MTTGLTEAHSRLAAIQAAEQMTTDRLAPQLRRIDAAVQEYERRRQALYHPSGAPIYADTDDRAAALLTDLEHTTETALAEADRLTREAQATLDREAHLEPEDRLSADELDWVNARMALVKEDCELLPLRDLVRRVQTALAGEDRAGWMLWQRYAGLRLDRERGRYPDRHPQQSDIGQLVALLHEARQRFRDPTAALQARGTLNALRTYRDAVWTRSGARGRALEDEMQQLRATGRYGSTF